MNKILIAPKKNDDPTWDSRPFGLTLAGCLQVAGMPLASAAVAEVTPEPQDSEQNALDHSCREESDRREILPESEPFHITSESSANWYIRQIACIESEKVRIQAQYERRLTELDADASGLRFLYDHELQAWVRSELAKSGNRRRSLTLLQGTASFRSVPASVRVSDPVAALEYARANGLPCILHSERVDANLYKELAQGDLLPGMDTTPEHETFTLKFGNQ